jgi:hypothetical protein
MLLDLQEEKARGGKGLREGIINPWMSRNLRDTNKVS